jgi:hypothetical protein
LWAEKKREGAFTGRRWFRRAASLPAPSHPTELLTVLPHDRGCRLRPNADAAALVDIGALGGYAPDDILGGQYRCHVAATLTLGLVTVRRIGTVVL